jgi:hypothetical protein
MAFPRSVIFLESMPDFLANPVNICFGSMPAKSTAPAAYLVIESNAITSNQQVESDMRVEIHPPTHSSQPDRGARSRQRHAL